MRILFVGEGPTDVGRQTCCDPSDSEALGAVAPVLVRKILEAHASRHSVRFDFVPRRFGWVRRGGFQRKIQTSMALAREQGFDAVVALTDRDGPSNHGRLKALRAGRDDAWNKDLNPLPCALGMPIETIEAWLLTPDAAREGLGLEETPAECPAPESLGGKSGEPDHPKSVFNSWCAEAPTGRFTSMTDAMAAVAERTDVDSLTRRCPQGFAPFAEEVRTRLGPLVK